MASEGGPRELSDVRARDAGLFAAVLLCGIAAVCALTAWFAARIGGGASAAAPGKLPPEPRLQRDESDAAELGALRRREDEILDGYGWVDRRRGVIRIPIARAMELYAERRGGRR